MSGQSLRELLVHLKSEIEATQLSSEQEQAILNHLKNELQDYLVQSEDGRIPEENSLPVRLEESIKEFELSHPTLTMTMGRVLDILSKGGI